MRSERVIPAQKIYGWYYKSYSFRLKNKFRQVNIFWEDDNSVLKVPPTKTVQGTEGWFLWQIRTHPTLERNRGTQVNRKGIFSVVCNSSEWTNTGFLLGIFNMLFWIIHLSQNPRGNILPYISCNFQGPV